MVEPHLIYLALGTNLGQRRQNLQTALGQLPPGVILKKISRVYETAPVYVLDQPPFLNMAVEAQTTLSPHDLLRYLKRIEAEMGRERGRRYGPRLIDLDIIFYDDWVVDTPDLKIPHPHLGERGFVLRPLADIAAGMIHPVSRQTIAEILNALPPDNGILRAIEWQPDAS